MEKELKKLRNTLFYLFQKDGLKAREVKHTKSDEVAVDDILSNEHFKNLNLDLFNAAIARSNHDKKLKEENHFLLTEDDDGRLIVKYFPGGIDYEESEIKENEEIQENLSKDQNSIKNDENEEDGVEDAKEAKEDGLITGGQKKKNKKKGKNKSPSEASVEKNSAVKEPGETSSKANKDTETATEQFKPVPAKGKKAKEGQKQREGTEKDVSGECSKEAEQELSSSKPPGDEEEQNEAVNCSVRSVSPLPADGICAPASGTPSKKKGKQSGAADPQHKENQSKQKKGAGKQTETNETKNAAKESKQMEEGKQSEKKQTEPNETKNAAKEPKQKEEGKQSENEPTKTDEKRGQNAKKADTPSKATEPAKKSPEKKQTKEANQLKTKAAVGAGAEADSSDDEKSPESQAESEAKKKKKKGTDDPVKQIPRIFQFLFTRNGLENKGIDVAEDGFVKVKSIVAAYPDWTEQQMQEVMGNSPFYVLQKDDAQDLVIKLKVEEKPSSSQGSQGTKERVENSEWKETGKKESSGNRRNEGGAFDNRRARNSPRDGGDFHLSKTMSYLLRHGAERLRLPMLSGGFIYVDDLLKYNDLRGYNESDVQRVVDENDKKRFFLARDPETGRLKVRANQGHTFEVTDLELEEIKNADDFPLVIHGTYTQSWNLIKTQGLKRMGRNHIHFAPGEPGADGVISGMRGSCDVLVYIDLQKAMNDGIKFFRSANNVILSAGDEKGTLLPKYFANAVQRHPRMKLPL